MLKTKLVPIWTGAHNILADRPCSDAASPDGGIPRRQPAQLEPAAGHPGTRRQAPRLFRPLQAVFQPARHGQRSPRFLPSGLYLSTKKMHGQILAVSRRVRRRFADP